MRRLREETLMSLDGVIEDPATWAGEYFDDEFQRTALERLRTCDAMLMGRRTYEVLARDWAAASGEFADTINGIRKYVFSSSMEAADWKNSTIVNGDVAAVVRDLKQQPGRDLVVYGHGQLAQALLHHHLIDDLRLSIFPVFLGRGKLLFRQDQRAAFKLIAATHLQTGVVAASYMLG